MDATVLSRSFMQMLAGSGVVQPSRALAFVACMCSRRASLLVTCFRSRALAFVACMAFHCRCPLYGASVSSFVNGFCHFYSQLSAMDVSVRTTMKGAAKCDKHCELQNSVNRQGLERILCFWDIPESMPASVSMLCCSNSSATPGTAAESACASRCASFGAPEASS